MSAIKKLSDYFSDIHPLVFHRSRERSRNDVDLFDILDGLRQEAFPVVWCDTEHRWRTLEDREIFSGIFRDQH